jgi:hypothetical protein
LQAVRTALAMLADPDGDNPFGDLQVLSQHTDSGPTAAIWQSARIDAHPACPLHSDAGTNPEAA